MPATSVSRRRRLGLALTEARRSHIDKATYPRHARPRRGGGADDLWGHSHRPPTSQDLVVARVFGVTVHEMVGSRRNRRAGGLDTDSDRVTGPATDSAGRHGTAAAEVRALRRSPIVVRLRPRRRHNRCRVHVVGRRSRGHSVIATTLGVRHVRDCW